MLLETTGYRLRIKYGVLGYYEKRQGDEFSGVYELLSDIRLGVDMNIIGNIPTGLLNEIMIEAQAQAYKRAAGKN